MIKMRPYVPSSRIAIRDSSIDEDISDDIDDDVFIKDSRTAKLNEEKGLKRPLMAPRHKNGKSINSVPIMKKHRRCCWRCCEPFCYALAAITILTAIISLAALILTMVPISMQKFKYWFYHNNNPSIPLSLSDENMSAEFVPCSQINVQKLWSKKFPRMNSESPVRKVDLNGDKISDIIFGFGVDDNIQYEGYVLPKCKSPLQGEEVPCEGGVIAVDGRNGELLWRSWSVANVFSLLCALDVNQDGYMDCVAAGRLGMIFAINGRNGHSIWEFREIEVETNSPIVMDLYTINVVRDLDGDEIPEILAVHLEEREESKAGHIKVIAGKTGKVIRTIPTPYREEVFVPVQLITKEDGTELLLIITGGQNTPGGVYSIRLLSLMKFTSEKEFTTLYHRKHSGLMVPAILTDVTGDGIVDIVVSAFNSTVMAFDGRNFTMLWNYTFPASDSVSAIVPGHFNHDNISDFMVKYNTGPGFPVYYYSQTTILDGRNGKPLLDSMMTDSGGASSLLGGVTISQTFGGDFFLHWQMHCRDKADNKDAYEFIPDSDIILQARADSCRLRYNTSSVVKLYAIAHDLDVRLNRTHHVRSSFHTKSQKSPLKHPKLLKKLLAHKELLEKVAMAEKMENLEKSKISHKAGSLRKPILEEDVLQEILPKNEISVEPVDNVYYGIGGNVGGYGGNMALRDFPKDYDIEPSHMSEDYEATYQDSEIPQIVPPNDHPIHLRTKYPGNRDVRSDINTFEEDLLNATNILTIGGVGRNKLEEPLSLWDLEREKEERDALRKAEKYEEENVQSLGEDGKSESTIATKRLKNRKRRELSEDNDWFLASISSTGILLQSLNHAKSSIDFAFVLNIRESEPYPPLFLPQDLNCVEEKISAYKSYTLDNQRILRKQFLKQCLSDRLINIEPEPPKYESQLIITRIGITCTCRSLQANEICSEVDDIDNQKWTEYMGNNGNGFYSN
uniref:FAM234A/B beta-propeller domain-containing protein n=1 Tax=Glossina palpalis gambiensis TaxID=67801 RepID=A0A1B0BPK9_9MUSC